MGWGFVVRRRLLVRRHPSLAAARIETADRPLA